ncbi:MAG: YkgJ family cysteine cluster protein [Ignavibacteriaceae bacterium]
MAKKLKSIFVPCNGCTLCCRGDAVKIDDEDIEKGYQVEPHPYVRGELMIAHKENGECIYLVENGCGIHDRAPLLCRSADCRSLALKFDFVTAMNLHDIGLIDIRVWDQGNKLLEEMKKIRGDNKIYKNSLFFLGNENKNAEP